MDFYIDDNTKTAIAVLTTYLINADGIVYESELSGLQEIKHKYGLTPSHFRNVNKMSLATAINKIIAAAKKQKDKPNLYSMIYDDLIKVAGINGNVSHEEAMICLAFRYAYDFQEAHFFDYEYKSIKLAKCEVIYIDDGQNEHIGELHEENRRYYDNISSIMKMYGFSYIYIPAIQEQLMAYPKEFLGNIIEYMYPNRATEDVVDNLSAKLTSDGVSIFGCQIMQEGAKMKTFPPSLLFKINESTVVAPKDNTRHTVFNLLQLPIKDGYRIQDTIQNFIRKYRSLVDRVHVDDSFNTDVKFNIRSFQRTLIDFYFALDKEYDKVLIKVNNTNKPHGKPQIKPQGKRQSQCVLKFSELTEVGLSKRQLSYYILILYLCKKGMPLLKGDKSYPEWSIHKDIYDAIAKELIVSEGFDNSLHNIYSKIRDGIKDVMPNNSNWTLYAPIRNIKTKEFSIGMDMQVYIDLGCGTYELLGWVDSLLQK